MNGYFAYLLAFLIIPCDAVTEQCDPDDVDCLVKYDERNIKLIRVKPGENATLPCDVLTSSTRSLEWWFGRRSLLVGKWPIDIERNGTELIDRYSVGADGSLVLFDVDRELVEEYECIIADTQASSFVLFRLDYSFFYDGPIMDTVFWGSCVVALIFCIASFILNILWIVVRKISLWWINRSERISRVRNVVEAMEKYRQRQMDNLHENYQRKITAIRENYHSQVDEIRTSYAKQADRFRGYRQAQMESMTQHLDNIRDNYNQQINRIREYGSRRAERLVESYERQLNRMRTFTLQHRLKLMRQYKVKQQYINRLLENIANNHESINENEKSIREMLDLPERNLPRSELARSASYYSLPELTLNDDDHSLVPQRSRRRFNDIFQVQQNSDEADQPTTSTAHQNSAAVVVDRLAEIDAEIPPVSDHPLLGHRRSETKMLPYVSRKAGMDSVDRQKIKEVVEQSSSGDYKAYHEKRKANWQQQLEVKLNEEASTSASTWNECRMKADNLMREFEKRRSLDRTFVHVDMDAFYAAVEMRDDPSLRSIPMAVGSNQMLSTSNYVARKFGVRSAMPGYIAKRLCPELRLVGVNFDKYRKASKEVRKVFAEYDREFYMGSLDEAYLDFTEHLASRQSSNRFPGIRYGGDCECRLPRWSTEWAESQSTPPTVEESQCSKCNKKTVLYHFEVEFGVGVDDAVSEMRFRIEQSTGLTCSAGIASNSFLSKICSEEKKPNNQFRLEADLSKIREFMRNLDVRRVPGVGPTAEYMLNGLGLKICGDILDNAAKVIRLFTETQSAFYIRAAMGLAGREVGDEEENENEAHRQSLSTERTFTATSDRSYLLNRLQSAAESVVSSMLEEGLVGCKNVGIKVKYSSFENVNRSKSSAATISSVDAVFSVAKSLLEVVLNADKSKKIRLLGIVLSKFVTAGECQKTLSDYLRIRNIPADPEDSDIIFERAVPKPKPPIKKSPEKPKAKKSLKPKTESNPKPQYNTFGIRNFLSTPKMEVDDDDIVWLDDN